MGPAEIADSTTLPENLHLTWQKKVINYMATRLTKSLTSRRTSVIAVSDRTTRTFIM